MMNNLAAPIGGLIGAVIGGALWAKYVQWTGRTDGVIAIGIGVLTGVGILFTSSRCLEREAKTMWRVVSIAAAFFAILGIFIGKYLDVQWNAVAQIAEQLSQEHNISMEQAMPIATTVFKGQSVWELMRARMSGIYDLLFFAAAAFFAFRIPSSRWLRNYFY